MTPVTGGQWEGKTPFISGRKLQQNQALTAGSEVSVAQSTGRITLFISQQKRKILIITKAGEMEPNKQRSGPLHMASNQQLPAVKMDQTQEVLVLIWSQFHVSTKSLILTQSWIPPHRLPADRQPGG